MDNATALTTATYYATTTICPDDSTVPAVATASSVAAPVMAMNATTANIVAVIASAMPSAYPITSVNATATQSWAVASVGSDKPVAAKSSGLPVQNSGAEKIAGSALFGIVALAAFVL